MWLLANIDLSSIDTNPARLDISLPANLFKQIDSYVCDHGANRSGITWVLATPSTRTA